MKRIFVALLAAMLFLQSGCSFLMEKEYFSVTDYNSESDSSTEPEIGSISSYTELVGALSGMVSQHQEKAELQFHNYAGSISDDLAQACWQLKSATALGAYMVDYISYDISRIVTYYKATVYINYSRSVEELSEIKDIGANKISDAVIDSVSNGSHHIAMKLYTSAIDSNAMSERVMSALMGAPSLVPVLPELSISVFSGSNLQHIFDITFKYAVSDAEIKQMRSELEDRINRSALMISADDAYSVSILAARLIANRCVYKADTAPGTAYDSLVLGVGESRSMAMAYSAICSSKGIESRVISGLKNNEQHYWNLAKVNGYWYHVDVTDVLNYSDSAVFLKNDSEMATRFRWDELDYPICDGPSLASAANSSR